jgi:hypothetical protein
MLRRNILFSIALLAAALYAVEGALELTHDQPTVFADSIDYWIEGFFAAALLASVAVLASLARADRSSRAATVGWALGAVGHSALLAAAIATSFEGRESLDALFGLGFLAIVGGYMTLTVVDLRGRLVPARGGLVLLVGWIAAIVVDSVGAGGIALAASWAALSRLLSTEEPSPSPTRRSTEVAKPAS